jgi:hypothetical protein
VALKADEEGTHTREHFKGAISDRQGYYWRDGVLEASREIHDMTADYNDYASIEILWSLSLPQKNIFYYFILVILKPDS